MIPLRVLNVTQFFLEQWQNHGWFQRTGGGDKF